LKFESPKTLYPVIEIRVSILKGLTWIELVWWRLCND